MPCENREPRFTISATRFYNFEVEWDVREVRLLSPTEADIVTVLRDPDSGRMEESIWALKLVDGGRAMVGRRGGAERFLRCADPLGRE